MTLEQYDKAVAIKHEIHEIEMELSCIDKILSKDELMVRIFSPGDSIDIIDIELIKKFIEEYKESLVYKMTPLVEEFLIL